MIQSNLDEALIQKLYLAASRVVKEADETPEGIILPIEHFKELEMAFNFLRERRISQLTF